ncbi:aminobenzoyl-glutamate transporter [Jeotgalibacillus alimentarius]|uniref:Aminobenzoyl-glutamate transporter n=1 Tax=Jeotgalibacillus alimentarius TaxID=135826 RepID=A0A0C2W2F8_9BACL|nr:AbgT family transporter [Jeotgalibacillus alimentarius]KIL50816.1 aminobenzoyl-glutamate transporter [Jeotgalibacillus alimentarius]
MDTAKKRGFFTKGLDGIERVGNKLPHPVTLFFLFAAIVVLASALGSALGWTVQNAEGEEITVFNLLSSAGILYMFESAVTNFTGFAPLGTVLVTMLGIGLAERSGLISAALKALVTSVPKQLLTAALVFGGIMSSMAADAGYVVLTPLGAVLFAGLGRHPLAGLAAAFAGVSAGFSANLLVTSLDPLLGDLTIAAASTFDPAYAEGMNILMNYYFMIASVVLLTIAGTFVTEKIVEPRLGTYKGTYAGEEGEDMTTVRPEEKKGLWASLIAIIVTSALIALLVVPSWGPLRAGLPNDEILSAPFFQTLVPILFIFFLIPGVVYGIVTKNIKNDTDIANQMGDTMATMGMYIVLAFAAGQFVAYFNTSNLGQIFAYNAAGWLSEAGLDGMLLVLAFMFVVGVINLFIGSSSAKWAFMAPVFVPIMMKLGYAPEFTQVLYRIADSTTNIISPLMPYFAIVIAFAQKYDKKVGIGTLISTMIPYTIVFSIVWVIMLLVFMYTGIDLGPGANIFYDK